VLPDADPDLVRQLRDFERHGYSIEDGVEVEGVYCVGAPIHSASGEVRHSISVIGLRRELRRSGFQALGAEVRETARRISEGLGYRFAA
jgi:IclR family acetate operon transcriptional repressor